MYIDPQLEELLRGLLPADDGTYRDGAFYDAAAALHYWTAAGPALLMDVERCALLDCVQLVGRLLLAIREQTEAAVSAPAILPRLAPRPGWQSRTGRALARGSGNPS